jgi:hypothetical protein
MRLGHLHDVIDKKVGALAYALFGWKLLLPLFMEKRQTLKWTRLF